MIASDKRCQQKNAMNPWLENSIGFLRRWQWLVAAVVLAVIGYATLPKYREVGNSHGILVVQDWRGRLFFVIRYSNSLKAAMERIPEVEQEPARAADDFIPVEKLDFSKPPVPAR